MNGLSLRIVRGGVKKSKNLIGFPPVQIGNQHKAGDNKLTENFNNVSSTDEQMAILKSILTQDANEDVFKFLVTVFLVAEAKHPVKCFITRHITKTEKLQTPFSRSLADKIKSYTQEDPSSYVDFMAVMSKVSACLENFPSGAVALKIACVELAGYLVRCLKCCVRTLNEQLNLSPTEKNEVFNLAHLALRILLHLVQKGSIDRKLDFVFPDTRLFIRELVSHEDVPMDTKSLSGILCLTMYIVENGPGSWVNVFDKQEDFTSLLCQDAGRLSLYSAVVTVVPEDQLVRQTVSGRQAVVVVVERLMEIGERNASESPFTLGVTRALLTVSKQMTKRLVVTNTEPLSENLLPVSDSGLQVSNNLLPVSQTRLPVSNNLLPVSQTQLPVSQNKPVSETLLSVSDKLLPFVWTHLDHHLDSVRHLTAQILANIVSFCVKVKNEGDSKPLDNLFSSLSNLDKHRKSYFVSVTLLVNSLCAEELLPRLPGLVGESMAALSEQAVQASAAMTLETLMHQYSKQFDALTVYQSCLVPILAHVSRVDLDSTVLGLLDGLLAKVVARENGLLDYILPHIQACKAETASSTDLKCVLMLVSAVRKARVRVEASELWRGLVSYEVLRRAAVDAVDETRMLSLSLIAESPRTTESFELGELSLLLYHMQHIAHATPNYRQLLQAPLKKFMKRLEDSYKVLIRQRDNEESYKIDAYQKFVEDLRSLCYGNLLCGANYSRRSVSLQILRWTEGLQLEGYERTWKQEYVERLLLHLEDGYENNKVLALEILERCPVENLKNRRYSVSLELEDIIRQASSLKPTDCVSASYKLELLRRRLPGNILKGETCLAPEPASYSLCSQLLSQLQTALISAQQSVVRAARDNAMYGLLHCLCRVMANVDVEAISACALWRQLVSDIIDICMSVCAAVACVVNNSSPEGHLPCDAGQIGVGDHGNSGGIVLEDGRPVTAQMVLLCAWRSVKEVSLLLGTMSSRLTISPPDQPTTGSISWSQLSVMGDHFTSLLAHTKHRGAFEQAYVGFTQLLARLWRSRNELHNLPRLWLQQLLSGIQMGDRHDATRRSAGLPFMIQALVTTEVQVQGNPKCFHHCMTTLLRLARRPDADRPHSDLPTSNQLNSDQSSAEQPSDQPISGRPDPDQPSADTRIHCLNILRALFRNSALDESVAGYVGEGFLVALGGFEGDTWAERNASTLAFSALMTRVFGATRTRDREAMAVRNKMTGRIFFMRYPQLYDFMMEKLQEPPSNPTTRPIIFPLLVLLSRLYPSSLEGSESGLRLSSLLPLALAAGLQAGCHGRLLAARAVLPLLSPLKYYIHMESLLTSILTPTNHNQIHGTLLQLTRLLGTIPDVPMSNRQALSEKLCKATWVLTQACGEMPNYVIADEFVKVLNMVVWRLPALATDEILNITTNTLQSLLFTENIPPITFGREICLANAMYLLLIITTKYKQENIDKIICNESVYKCYDVTLAVLNYLLIFHKNLDIECKFQEHINLLSDENILTDLRKSPKYIPMLCNIFEKCKYLECTQKSLKVLSLEENTQKCIVQIKTGIKDLSDEMVLKKLFELIENEHENLTHIYLECLSTFFTEKLRGNEISRGLILEVVRVIFACSTPDNGEDVREVVVKFLERNFVELIKMDDGWNEQDKFEHTATLWSTLASLLEDDSPSLRTRTSSIASAHLHLQPSVPARVCRMLRDTVHVGGGTVAMLLVLALLDFKSEVCITDEISDECRVFDQNERHNMILEETIWTNDCAERIRQIHGENAFNHVLNICEHPTYKHTIDKLCNNNVIMFKKLAKGENFKKSAILNPKIKLFIDKLSG